MSASDKVFAGSVPEIYETYLVPLIFTQYAADVVARLKSRSVSKFNLLRSTLCEVKLGPIISIV